MMGKVDRKKEKERERTNMEDKKYVCEREKES